LKIDNSVNDTDSWLVSKILISKNQKTSIIK